MNKERLLKGLSEYQIDKIHECKNTEELLLLAKLEGYELSDEQLEYVSGGGLCSPGPVCPHCTSTNTCYVNSHPVVYKCYSCQEKFVHEEVEQ